MARNRSAFTFIELLVVLGIIAALVVLAFPVFAAIRERARVTQDMNNLRQIGLATQMYLNDNDNALFLPTAKWPGLLNPKYISTWKTFLSPFDKNAFVDDSATARVSYGVNQKAIDSSGAALVVDRISNPSAFIVFAAAPDQSNPLHFSGTANTPTPVNPPGSSSTFYGTHSNRKRTDACMADWHVENMDWSTFSDSSSSTTAQQRWNP